MSSLPVTAKLMTIPMIQEKRLSKFISTSVGNKLTVFNSLNDVRNGIPGPLFSQWGFDPLSIEPSGNGIQGLT